MSAPDNFVARTQDWVRDIDETLAMRSQLARRGLTLIMGILAVLCLVLLLQALITPTGPAYLGLALNLILALLALAWLRKRERIHPGLLLTVCSVMTANHLVAVYFNGLLPLLLITPLLVMTHLLLNTAVALVLSMGLIVGAQVLVWMVHPSISQELWLRVTGINLGMLLLLQTVTRYWRDVSKGFRDISQEMVEAQLGAERALLESESQRDAARYIDAATGLPNRAGLELALVEHIQGAARDKRLGVVIWGIQAEGGADLTGLHAIVERVRSAGAPAQCLATDGAGQWLGLLPAEGEDPAAWTEGIQSWLDKVGSGETPDAMNRFATCVGFAVWPDDGADARTLLRRAEMAREMARSMVSNKPLRFESGMEERAERQARLLADMEAGLARNEFELHYQPIVTADDGAVYKAEALIRWNHPQRGRVSPGEFIPAAEQSYLIVEMTDKILEMAAHQVRQWRRDLHPDFQISVNMPPAYLAKCARHPGQMLPRLHALGAPWHSIVLEITEGALLQVDDELLQALQLVRDQGFLIALDDFGIGYSSFSKLPRLPLDFLKLDKSFVDALERGAAAQAVCHTIVSLAHDLGMTVVAEGVEDQTQYGQLLKMGTDFFQGFLFSRPLPVKDFMKQAQSLGVAPILATPDNA